LNEDVKKSPGSSRERVRRRAPSGSRSRRSHEDLNRTTEKLNIDLQLLEVL